MKKGALFIIIFFITAALCGLRLYSSFTEPLPEITLIDAEKPLDEAVFEREKKIQSETDDLLYLFDRMPPVAVYLTNETIVKDGTNTERGVGYTTCDNNDSPTIYIKKEFYRKANEKQRVNILKHELTHAYLCRRRQMSGHDEVFRRKFAEVGGFGN